MTDTAPPGSDDRPNAVATDGAAPQYDVAHLMEHLASDPRTAELGLKGRIRGRMLFLDGTVTSEEQKRLIEQVAAERLPGLTIHNDLRVSRPEAPRSQEELS